MSYWSKKSVCLVMLLLSKALPGFTQVEQARKVCELGKKLSETSALIYVDGKLYSLGDNKKPELYRIDTATCKIQQTIIVNNATFQDKEALSYDDTFIYIGDFGNNNGSRRDLKIVRIRRDELGSSKEVVVGGETIYFSYPELKTFSTKSKDVKYDCEAMVVLEDSVYLFTKQHNNYKTTLYALPKVPGTWSARKKLVFDSQGLITDAALSPDARTLLLLGYTKKHESAFIWKFTGFSGADFFGGSSVIMTLSSGPANWQTEGITFIGEDDVFISCEESEQVRATLYRISIKALSGIIPSN